MYSLFISWFNAWSSYIIDAGYKFLNQKMRNVSSRMFALTVYRANLRKWVKLVKHNHLFCLSIISRVLQLGIPTSRNPFYLEGFLKHSSKICAEAPFKICYGSWKLAEWSNNLKSYEQDLLHSYTMGRTFLFVTQAFQGTITVCIFTFTIQSQWEKWEHKGRSGDRNNEGK